MFDCCFAGGMSARRHVCLLLACVLAIIGFVAPSTGLAQEKSEVVGAGVTPALKTGLSPGIPRRLARSDWVKGPQVSAGAPVVYVFTDPECPYCHKLWNDIQALRPGVEVRYVLVGVIGPQSRPKAAAILQSADPAKALAQNEAGFERGGVAPAKKIEAHVSETLALNATLMDAIGIPATPALIFENAAGEVSLYVGVPDAARLREILRVSR